MLFERGKIFTGYPTYHKFIEYLIQTMHCSPVLFTDSKEIEGTNASSCGIAFPQKETLTETAKNAGSKQRTTFQPGSDFCVMKKCLKINVLP